MLKARFLILAIILLCISPLYSKTIEVDPNMTEVPIGPFLEYYEDTDGQLRFEDIRSKKYNNKWNCSDAMSLGLGFTRSVLWLRFTLENISEKEVEFYLEQDYPLMDKITLFVSDGGTFRIIETGDDYIFSQRPYKHRKFVFPIKIPAKSHITCYMRYQTDSSMNIVLKLWDPVVFTENSSTEYRLLTLFYGAMIIMILYNMFIYLFIRYIVYFFYALCIFLLLLLLMALDGTAYEFLWPDSPWLVNFSIPILINLVLLFFGLFGVELVELRTRRNETFYRNVLFKVIIVLYSLCIPMLVLDFFLPYRYAIVISTIWAGICITSVFVFTIILIIKEMSKPAIIGFSASFCFLAGAFAYVLKTLGILPSNFFTEWSFYIGMAVMMVLFANGISYRINRMSRTIIAAEKKYRGLVESSDDIIFSLDVDLNFLSANRALGKHLGYVLEDVIGRNLFEFIHESGNRTQQYSTIVVKDYIRELRKTKKSITIKTDFKTSFSHEPKSFSLKLEYIGARGAPERFLGKASLIADDLMLEYIESERHSYSMDNYLNTAELMCHRLTRNLGKNFNSAGIVRIRIALREVLINAIEHGNLNVLYEEKTQILSEGNYLNFIQERQNDPKYKDRNITIDYLWNNEKVVYKITDEGDGFDHRTMVKQCTESAQKEVLTHGRGLVMVHNTFDEVTFNKKGNQILLVKYFDSEKNQS